MNWRDRCGGPNSGCRNIKSGWTGPHLGRPSAATALNCFVHGKPTVFGEFLAQPISDFWQVFAPLRRAWSLRLCWLRLTSWRWLLRA
jgi:hypothetical protein